MRRQLALICAISALITISSGFSDFRRDDGAGRIIYQADSPERIGAYFVSCSIKHQQRFRRFTRAHFGIVTDINNTGGITKIGGFALTDYESYNSTLAEFDYEGDGGFTVIVRELYGYDANPVTCETMSRR